MPSRQPSDTTPDPDRDNYAVMGNPVAHSKSPLIHAGFARQTGEPVHYYRILVPVGGLADAVADFRRQGGKGLNITLPFKEDAFRLAECLSDRARLAGAVNTLSLNSDGSLAGDNTDGAGLVRDLQNHEVDIAGRGVLILGAGGAVRGILSPLADCGPASITIANRTLARAEELIQSVPVAVPVHAIGLDKLATAGSYDLIINGISAGLAGELPPLPDGLVTHNTVCYDMVYGTTATPFVRWAHARGASLALDGLGMLVEQAAESFRIWRGVRPDTAPVMQMLQEQLT